MAEIKPNIKEYFEANDFPTEAQFYALFDATPFVLEVDFNPIIEAINYTFVNGVLAVDAGFTPTAAYAAFLYDVTTGWWSNVPCRKNTGTGFFEANIGSALTNAIYKIKFLYV